MIIIRQFTHKCRSVAVVQIRSLTSGCFQSKPAAGYSFFQVTSPNDATCHTFFTTAVIISSALLKGFPWNSWKELLCIFLKTKTIGSSNFNVQFFPNKKHHKHESSLIFPPTTDFKLRSKFLTVKVSCSERQPYLVWWDQFSGMKLR